MSFAKFTCDIMKTNLIQKEKQKMKYTKEMKIQAGKELVYLIRMNKKNPSEHTAEGIKAYNRLLNKMN